MFVTEQVGLKTLEGAATSLTQLHGVWSQEDFSGISWDRGLKPFSMLTARKL